MRFWLLVFVVIVALPNNPASAQQLSSMLRLSRFAGWGADGQGMLVTSVAVDRLGNVWAGTEDSGVWTISLAAVPGSHWSNFGPRTGLADRCCTTLLSDSEGRIWAGTLNHGVSVFDGRRWNNYDSSIGPLGDHVFAIAEDPADHSVWIATENGISRYDQTGGTWSYLTKADGLPSNQISAIAFDSSGNVYVGSQCDGIGLSTPGTSYRSWRTVAGPWRPTHAAGGDGLPSAVINAISVSKNGTVYVGTDWGLAETTDSGVTWHYIRGDDWPAVAKGEHPPVVSALDAPSNATLLSDYVTAITEDQGGNLWVGHREYGAEVFETATFRRTGQTSSSGGDFITCVLPTTAGILFGTCGSGLSVLTTDTSDVAPIAIAPATTLPLLPAPATPPATGDLAALTTRLGASQVAMKPGDATYLSDDWATQGNWMRGYGKQYAQLCESWDSSKNDFITDNNISVSSFLGPTNNTGDFLASWVAEPISVMRCALYDPCVGNRNIANWNDNGEAYPATLSGGDLWLTVTVPTGVYRLSTYFFNNDGDSSGNRDRDYLEEIRPHATDNGLENVSGQPLAMARVVDFRSGIYKSFALCGPSTFDVRINRNFSLNGMISAIFIDKLTGPADGGDTAPAPWLHGVSYSAPTVSATTGAQNSAANAVLSLWSVLDGSYDIAADSSLQEPYRLLAYRAAESTGVSDSALEGMRWETHTWSLYDDTKFDFVAARSFRAAVPSTSP